MFDFFERRPRRAGWLPWRRKSVAEKVLETPGILVDNAADAAGDLISRLPFVSLVESKARHAARLAREEAREAERAGRRAGRAIGREAAHLRAAAMASASDFADDAADEARAARRFGARQTARARAAAANAYSEVADELDRLSGKAARLSSAAAADLRPRRRTWLESLLRGPTTGERVAEGAHRAKSAGFDLIADIGAPLFSLWLATKGQARQGVDWTAEQGRRAADVALDRPTGWRAWLFGARPRRVERVKARAAAAQAQTAEKLDEMKVKLEEMRRKSLALGDSEAARKAREALDKLARLRVTVTEEPAPPGAFDRLLTALGAAPPLPEGKVRASMSLWPFGANAAPTKWSLGGGRGGSSLGYAAAALGAVTAYALIQSLLPADKGAGFAKSGDQKGGAFAVAARTAEPGRGRTATGPSEIPAKGWKDILLRTWDEIGHDRLLAISAGVVFYGLLALFPAITALVSSYGLFASPATISEHLGFLQGALPPGAYDIVREQIERVVSAGETKLGLSFVFGLGLAIWSANAGVKAVLDALNIVYDEEEKRGFFKLNAVSLAFTVGAIVAVLVGIGAIVVVPIVVNAIGFGQGETVASFVSILRWPLLIVMLMLGLAVLYRYGPSRREAQWQWLSVGALVATALWIVGSVALSYYISKFGDYDKTYGSLGAAIGMMMWMWLSAIVVLFGAELNSEIEHQTAEDSTVGAPKPLGMRGANMADSVGAARS
jgi:membrane protein